MFHHPLPEARRLAPVEDRVASLSSVIEERPRSRERGQGIAVRKRERRIPEIREHLVRGDGEHGRGFVHSRVAARRSQHFFHEGPHLDPPVEDRHVHSQLLVHASRGLPERIRLSAVSVHHDDVLEALMRQGSDHGGHVIGEGLCGNVRASRERSQMRRDAVGNGGRHRGVQTLGHRLAQPGGDLVVGAEARDPVRLERADRKQHRVHFPRHDLGEFHPVHASDVPLALA